MNNLLSDIFLKLERYHQNNQAFSAATGIVALGVS